MQKDTIRMRLVIVGVALVFFASIMAAAVLYTRPTGTVVVLVQDGVTIETIDLSSASDRIFTVTAPDGGSNTICIENHTIRITEADCPDQTCVSMGQLASEATPLVCLPHKLLIRYGEDS